MVVLSARSSSQLIISLKRPKAILTKSSNRNPSIIAMCQSPSTQLAGSENGSLKIGSPVIVVEAPATLKTANSISCLRVNAGLVKPGDVGRIVARKPKDVWAVRLAIGTYLIDGKFFEPLDVEE